jgi:GNAT superfamily N-acetyltransferase
MITEISYDIIEQIWKDYLWKTRSSKIESISAMLYLKGYDLNNYNYIPKFFGYKLDDKIVGVNSGHKCFDHTYRSRGLFVFPEYRNHGVGKELLLATIEQGRKEKASLVWSYPRQESWSVYESAGFSLASGWNTGETGVNAFCKIYL